MMTLSVERHWLLPKILHDIGFHQRIDDWREWAKKWLKSEAEAARFDKRFLTSTLTIFHGGNLP